MVNGPWQIPGAGRRPRLQLRRGADSRSTQPGQTVVAPLGGEAWTVPQTGDEAKQAKAAELVVPEHRREPAAAWPRQRQTVPTKTALLDAVHAEDARRWPASSTRSRRPGPAPASSARTGRRRPRRSTPAMQLALTGQAAPAEALASRRQLIAARPTKESTHVGREDADHRGASRPPTASAAAPAVAGGARRRREQVAQDPVPGPGRDRIIALFFGYPVVKNLADELPGLHACGRSSPARRPWVGLQNYATVVHRRCSARRW